MTATPKAKQRLIRAGIIVLVMACIGCLPLPKKIEQIDVNTANLEATIKAALIKAEEVDAAAILVTVINDTRVSLSGFVASEDESSTAERVAKEAQPGLQIDNELTVQP